MVERGRVREAIEIKLTSEPSPEDLGRLAKVGKLIEATRVVLLCRVRQSSTTGARWVANLPDYLDTIR